MSSLASQWLPRLPSWLVGRPRSRFDVSPWVVLGLLAWTSLMVPVMGIKGARYGGLAYITMTAIWISVLVVRFVRHRELDPNLEFASLWTSIVGLAYLATSLGSAQSIVLLAPIAVAISAAVCNRYPVQAVFALAIASAGYGSLQALYGIRVGPPVHLILSGLWVGLIWRVITKRRQRALWTWPAMFLVAAYMAVTLLELPTAESLYIGIRTISVGPWYMLGFVAIAYAGLSQDKLLNLGRALVLVATAVGGYAFVRHFIGPASAETAFARAVGGGYNTVDGSGDLSLFGSFPGRHNLAVWATCAVPLLAGCALGWRDRWRWVAALGAGFCVFDILETKVRVAIPGVLAGLIVTVVLYAVTPVFGGRRLGVAMSSVAAVAAVGITLFLALGINDSGHYNGLLHPKNDSSFSERTYKWGAALRDISHHPSGYGLGSAGFQHDQYGRFYLTSNLTIENAYLVIAYQEGFIVMALFIAMVLALLASLSVRAVTTRSVQKATLAIGPIGALTSFAVLMITGPYLEGFPALWVWLLVGLGTAQFAFREPPEDPETTGDVAPAPARVAVPA